MSYCYRCICPSELDGNTPLLKTQHIFVIRHREIKLELTWNHPPFLFTFIVLVNALESNVGERHQWHPRSQHPHGIISMCHVNFAHSQQWRLWELSTAFGLNLKHAPQKGFQSLVLYINLVNILGLQGSHALEKTLLPMKLSWLWQCAQDLQSFKQRWCQVLTDEGTLDPSPSPEARSNYQLFTKENCFL